jgi:hypothetical protein
MGNDGHNQNSVWTAEGQLALLKEALRAERSADGNGKRQRGVMRRVCLLPENRGLTPEHFVLSVKRGLNAAASDLGMKLGPEREQLMSRLLSISIEEFFAADCGDGIASSKTGLNASQIPRVRRHSAGHGDGDCRGI